MCECLINNYINKNSMNIIKNIKKKIKSNIDNPPLKIESIHLPDKNKKINIVQEGYLIAGTKQRVAKLFVKKILKDNSKIDSLLYCGSSNGFGAVATSYAANKLNLKSYVFLSGNIENINTRQINTMKALGSNITICPTYREARDLEWKMANNPDKKWTTLDNFYVVPLGLNDEKGIMIDLLSKQIKKASKGTILDKHKNPVFWLVAGSGGILQSLYKAYPYGYFNIYLTGAGMYKKKVITWAKSHNNVNILKEEFGHNNLKNRKTYYSTVQDYDDFIWPYVKKYAKDGDFIWNVASDDYFLIS